MKKWLVASLVLHALVWLALPDRALLVARPSVPVQLSLLLAPPLEPLSAPAPKPHPRARLERQAPALRLPAPAESFVPKADSAPSMLQALDAGHLAALSSPAPASAPMHVVPESIGSRIDARVGGAARLAQSARAGPRGVLVEMGARMREDFRPNVALTHVDQSAFAAQLAQWKNEASAQNRDEASASPAYKIPLELSPAAREGFNAAASNLQFEAAGPRVMLCFGACGQHHEIARMSAIIRLDHALDGSVAEPLIEVSSGLLAFDRQCLESAAGVAALRLQRFANEPVPETSYWRFDQIVYRYNRAELLLDPAFKPEGSRDSERASIFGETAVSTRVAFIGASYRVAASDATR